MLNFLKKTPLLPGSYWFLRKKYWNIKFKQGLFKYCQKNHIRKLQIGCSTNVLKEWFNVDIIPFYEGAFYLDATLDFPIPDQSFDYIFSEHMIEHIDYIQGWHMLQECYRILKPGGKIRVSTPDLMKLVGLFNPEKTEEQKNYISSVMNTWRPEIESLEEGYVINVVFGFEHKFIYDKNTLAIALRKAGFHNITLMNPRSSQFKEFAGIDVHVNDYIEFETLVLEAEKPE